MEAADLAPFAHALGVAAYFVFPDGAAARSAARPAAILASGRSVISEARVRRTSSGPMELSQLDPEGRGDARAVLDRVLAALPDRRVRRWSGSRKVGCSRWTTCCTAARRLNRRALALLSSTRIAFADWLPRAPMLASLPVLVAHGRDDPELAFAAGELHYATLRRSPAARTSSRGCRSTAVHELPAASSQRAHALRYMQLAA